MKHRLPSLLFVALCGLAPAALGNLLHWSPWLWGFMSMVTASGSLLLVMTVLTGGRTPVDPYEPAEPESPTAPVEQPYRETRVVDAALPSATKGYDFLFSATVWWRPAAGHAGRPWITSPSLAVSSIVNRAEEVARREEPDRDSFARYLLEGELAVPLPDRSGQVEVLAADVTLTLAPADRDRLRKLSDLRKDEELWEHERQHERNKRRYLGDDVLKSAGSAVVWWLARHENEIEKAVDMIGPLAQIAAAAHDEEVPELFRHLLVSPTGSARAEAAVGGPLWDGGGPGTGLFDREEEVTVPERLLLLLTALGLKPDMDEYTVFVHRVLRNLEAAELHEAAEDIRRTLFPSPDEHAGERPEGGFSDGGDTRSTWSTGFTAAPESPPFSDGAPGTSAPGPQENGADRDWFETDENGMPPRYFWDPSHTPHPPTEPRPWPEDEEDDGADGHDGEGR